MFRHLVPSFGQVRTPGSLLLANFAILLVMIAAGWVSSATRSSPASLGSAALEVHASDSVVGHAVHIASANLSILLVILLGAATFGLLSVLVLGWNGYLLGFGLSFLARTSPDVLPWTVLYVPIEFGAFLLASTAAQHLALGILRTCVESEPLRWRPTVVLALVAAVLVVVAAVLEVDVAVSLGTAVNPSPEGVS